MKLKYPVGNLEYTDFDSNGNLLGFLANKAVFIMIQGSFCPQCNLAKPAFQQLAEKGQIICATIVVDSTRDAEIKVNDIINLIYPGIQGVPSYVLYINNKKYYYTGNRTLEDMEKFVQQKVSNYTN
jgi:thiol-disulfide isomerase/thioredoxin